MSCQSKTSIWYTININLDLARCDSSSSNQHPQSGSLCTIVTPAVFCLSWWQSTILIWPFSVLLFLRGEGILGLKNLTQAITPHTPTPVLFFFKKKVTYIIAYADRVIRGHIYIYTTLYEPLWTPSTFFFTIYCVICVNVSVVRAVDIPGCSSMGRKRHSK